jgi:hypothetical protein
LEELGIPTITVTTNAFLSLSRATLMSIGLPDMALVEAAHPMGMVSLEEIRAQADKTFPEVLKLATQWKPARTEIPGVGKPPYPAERVRFKGTYEALNTMFYDRNWSLGLPILPPTPEAVAAMLKGTSRKPEEVVWVVPPRMGQLTVELVAALGYMAGARPEHMPLLLAAVKVLSHPDFDWRGATTTTGCSVPVLVINGPILDELGVGYSTGVLGGRQPVNIALGVFVNLVGDIVGGSIQPDPDKSTHGTRADLAAVVFGENEKANPWKQSYAVEKGFKPTESVVSGFAAYNGNNNTDHSSVKSTELLNTLAIGITGAASGVTSCFTRYDKGYGNDNKVKYVFVFLGPEHADTIYREFPTKKAVQEYFVKKCAAPYWTYAPTLCTPPKELGPYNENTMMPRFTQAEQIHIVVTGGPGKQSLIFPSFPTNNRVVSVVVEK